MLAGDTLRSAADTAAPIVAISLAHRRGYFRQHLDANGQQTETDRGEQRAEHDAQPWRVTVGHLGGGGDRTGDERRNGRVHPQSPNEKCHGSAILEPVEPL